jgi:hypothetical protein
MNGKDSRATLWDLKYEQGLPSLTKPDPFFLSAYDRFVAGRFPSGGSSLDLAGGLGRHALWLAARSWQVDVVDISEVAIEKLGQEASQRNLKLDLFAVDAAEYDFEARPHDLIVLFYHFDRSLSPRIVCALKPGGLFICKMAIPWGSKSELSRTVDEPLARNELPALDHELDVLDYRERPVRDRGVVEFVGAKTESRRKA